MGSPERRADVLVGVGGLGWGTVFELQGDATLGRNESRGGRLLDRRDYCKLHIVSHYVRALLGPRFRVAPVGVLGDDDAGRRIRAEMVAGGLDDAFVRTLDGVPTLYSFCFVYPDGSGGNLTTVDGAASQLDVAGIDVVVPLLRTHGPRAIAMALPEAPLAARRALIDHATTHGALRIASFTAGEMPDALEDGCFSRLDLVALNREEAAVIAPSVPGAIERLREANHAISVSVTCGAEGSWTWDGAALRHLPAHPVRVVGTAGAGDAHLAGIVAGIAAGLDLPSAHELAVATASMALTSPHSIDERVAPGSLLAFCAANRIELSRSVRLVLDSGGRA